MPDPVSSVANLHRFGVSSGRPNANTVVDGTQYWDTDSGVVSQSDTVDWTVLLTSGGGGGAWELAGTGYTSIGTWDQSVDGTTATPLQFEDLGAFSEIMVICRAITKSVSGLIVLRVGYGAGPTILSSSGDYEGVASTGVATAATAIPLHDTNATAARSAHCIIRLFNTTLVKLANTRAAIGFAQIPTTNELTAVQVFLNAGGNFTGGTVHVYGR